MSYGEAIELLQEEIAKDPSKWEYPDVEFGTDLSTEHERWLAETVFKEAPSSCTTTRRRSRPSTCATTTTDRQTVAAMDLLVPGVGELIGGSQREERLDVLLAEDGRRRPRAGLLVVPRPAPLRLRPARGLRPRLRAPRLLRDGHRQHPRGPASPSWCQVPRVLSAAGSARAMEHPGRSGACASARVVRDRSGQREA